MRNIVAALAILGGLILQEHVTAQQPPGALTFAGRPQRIVLLVDSSTVAQNMMPQIRTGLLAFLDNLQGNPELAFLTSGGQMRIRVRPTGQRAEIRKAAEGYTADGGANAFVDSMLEADQRFLKPATDRKHVFVIIATESTKDNDTNVDRYNRFMQDFRTRGGVAHAIVIGGLNRGMTTDIAKNIVDNTGGRFERIAEPTALAAILRNIAARVSAAELR